MTVAIIFTGYWLMSYVAITVITEKIYFFKTVQQLRLKLHYTGFCTNTKER